MQGESGRIAVIGRFKIFRKNCAPIAWDPSQVNGPLARTAEDVALALDAMAGFSRLTPISMPKPWPSASAVVAQTTNARGRQIAYCSDIAGIGVDPEIDEICRRAARGLSELGATVDEIAFDASDGRAPYMALRGAWMVGQQFANLARLEEFGANLQGNVRSGLKVTALDIAAVEQQRIAIFHRFRALFERYDALLTPAAPVKPFPVEMNYPSEVNGRKLENYIDWIAPSFLITLMSFPAASVPAGMTAGGLPAGLQVVAPRFEEPFILSIAKLIQQSNPIGFPPHA